MVTHASRASSTPGCREVAVVGAGAAGLVAARELRRENLAVTVFERGSEVGGTWVYTASCGSTASSSSAYHIHSSLYESLRVNLPKEIMGYSDFPFLDNSGSRYCGHAEVKDYLRSFVQHFDLESMLEMNTLVEEAEPAEGGKWRLRVRPRGDQEGHDRVFDAVVVCNGHFESPKFPQGVGRENFSGSQLHSCDYKTSDDDRFVGKRVLVVGMGPSGDDLCREVAEVASKVYWSGRGALSVPTSSQHSHRQPDPPHSPLSLSLSLFLSPFVDDAGFDRFDEERLRSVRSSLRGNVILRGNVASVSGKVVTFEKGSEDPVEVDTILWCTGYHYAVPFLKGSGAVQTERGRIEPLYEHLFHPKFGPKLSFVGLGFRILPFPFFEIQTRWVARCLSGRCSLPTEQEMAAEAEAFYGGIEGEGARVDMTHCMDGVQWDYLDRVARNSGGAPKLEDWKIGLYEINRVKKARHPKEYRDLTLPEEVPLMEKGAARAQSFLAQLQEL